MLGGVWCVVCGVVVYVLHILLVCVAWCVVWFEMGACYVGWCVVCGVWCVVCGVVWFEMGAC
jgi:hypothetical protein